MMKQKLILIKTPSQSTDESEATVQTLYRDLSKTYTVMLVYDDHIKTTHAEVLNVSDVTKGELRDVLNEFVKNNNLE